jgi:hypothetical protein
MLSDITPEELAALKAARDADGGGRTLEPESA